MIKKKAIPVISMINILQVGIIAFLEVPLLVRLISFTVFMILDIVIVVSFIKYKTSEKRIANKVSAESSNKDQ